MERRATILARQRSLESYSYLRYRVDLGIYSNTWPCKTTLLRVLTVISYTMTR